jgi:hypothetical protein
VNAAIMSLQVHDRGIHAVCPGAGGAEVTAAGFHLRAAAASARSPEKSHTHVAFMQLE